MLLIGVLRPGLSRSSFVTRGPIKLSRSLAWSRYPTSSDARNRRITRREIPLRPGTPHDALRAQLLGGEESPLPGSVDAEEGLQRLLEHDTLVVVRQLEMMNIFLGFEQANRYAITDIQGNHVGYMAEEDRGFLGTISRQAFRTHRAFKSVIMDRDGTPVLWINRPFSWINSRLFVQRKIEKPSNPEEDHVILGEAQQEWHLWRRRYNLFERREEGYQQFAKVDSGFLAWHFYLQDEEDRNIASITRNFAGFGRELFTDTGQYAVTFKSDPDAPSNLANPNAVAIERVLSLEERALVLALSVGIDFDYFSRHSEGSGMGFPMFWWFSSDE